YARNSRRGRHFDPASTMTSLLNELADLYGKVQTGRGEVYQLDVTHSRLVREAVSSCSHIITSPPYINAQDYFRNFKLELYLLEGLLPYNVDDIIHRFVGTERGVGRSVLTDPGADERRQLVPELKYLERAKEEQAVVVHRY